MVTGIVLVVSFVLVSEVAGGGTASAPIGHGSLGWKSNPLGEHGSKKDTLLAEDPLGQDDHVSADHQKPVYRKIQKPKTKMPFAVFTFDDFVLCVSALFGFAATYTLRHINSPISEAVRNAYSGVSSLVQFQ
eukprot:gnl/MRDRNA2_/MRDRNA2_88272_c0_seq1.p1 gnl/MRDRNA2_/MRDRNA2_88272_c0~~gnl/MRDRNA2_/MRDRNA2_88272_c0_seq1.p1  ORF type:complete len:132 (+),score=18.65 gnl/MRDRNA2_/MRDRNA2_88272_c0_seq1:113-508(+)